MGYKRFLNFFFDFPGTESCFLSPNPYQSYCFCLEPDPYQSLVWIRIRNKFFHILNLDPYQIEIDPPLWSGKLDDYQTVSTET